MSYLWSAFWYGIKKMISSVSSCLYPACVLVWEKKMVCWVFSSLNLVCILVWETKYGQLSCMFHIYVWFAFWYVWEKKMVGWVISCLDPVCVLIRKEMVSWVSSCLYPFCALVWDKNGWMNNLIFTSRVCSATGTNSCYFVSWADLLFRRVWLFSCYLHGV